ncbi:MAG: RecQ family ATP-dependent DNA helicase [Thermoplasmata archaeon]
MDPYEKSKIKTNRYKKLKKLLKIVYGYDCFRSKQYEIINRVINGEDVCAIMATGMGKSLCFQVPALYLDKPAIIVSPTIALMNDQKNILSQLGIKSCCYNSSVSNKKDMLRDILQFKYRIIYITPESVVNLKNFLVDLEDKQGISLIAIDEAHCISSYGFDFRKKYRELSFFKKYLPKIPILAITATATPMVIEDICEVLRLNCETPIVTSFNRPNLYLEVRKKSNSIGRDIIPIIKKFRDSSIIIYCLTKKKTHEVADVLKAHGIMSCVYHADLDIHERNKAHNNFIKGNIKIIIATIAFGMGINKPDVRVVIHYGAPKNIESYYQEIGRAGRDGNNAYCYIFYGSQDFIIQEKLIRTNSDMNYRRVLLDLLEKMKLYLISNKCRKQVLLEYFGEKMNDKCNFCDNCCNTEKKMDKENLDITSDMKKYARIFINLVESIKNRHFGIKMCIKILKGIDDKNIPLDMKKSKFYGIGRNQSFAWWKRLAKKLIEMEFLKYEFLDNTRFMQIKTTHKGIVWANSVEIAELGLEVTGK